MIIAILLGGIAAGLGVCLLKLHQMFNRFSVKHMVSEMKSIDQLPSVSLCIPARDETHAMTECLQRALASNYPKLEIIVLDDGSRDDTSLLIKSFAHAGVRFVEGSPLPDGWLGKNHALQQLLDQASGSYILFADVDTRFSVDTIGQMVADMQYEDAQMISVLPMRADGYRTSVLFSTLRQFWSIVFHTTHRPAVASNAWMVQRSVMIKDIGGFADCKSAVRPEVAVAAFASTKKAYRFLISSTVMGLTYEKRWSSQIETSVRLAFPLLGHSYLRSAAVAVGMVTVFATPLAGLLAGLFAGGTIEILLAVVCIVAAHATYGYYLSRIWAKGWLVGVWLLPYIIIQEIAVVIISAWDYYRGSVTWKGRPVRIR